MDETVRIDNYSFTYEKCNEREGTPLVFLHGWCSVRFFWNYCLPDFTPDYPCVNFDLLGHYHSKVSPAFYKHFDEERLFVTQKEAIQKALNTERIRLIGHSAGAFVALGIAAMFPEFVEKAVVVCPPAHGPVRGLLYPAKLANDFGLSFINYGTIDLIKLFPGLIETWFSQGAAEPKKLIAIEGMKEFLREYHEYFKENNVRMVNRYLEILDKADILHLLDQYQVPTLLIAGRKDKVVSPSQFEAISKNQTEIDLVYFEESAHIPMMEEKELFIRTVKNFLDS